MFYQIYPKGSNVKKAVPIWEGTKDDCLYKLGLQFPLESRLNLLVHDTAQNTTYNANDWVLKICEEHIMNRIMKE